MKGVRTSTIQLYKIIVKCEQWDGPPRPSAHHITGRLKKNLHSCSCIIEFIKLVAKVKKKKSDAKEKAAICNWQFQSAFKREANSDPPSKGLCPFSSKEEIAVD